MMGWTPLSSHRQWRSAGESLEPRHLLSTAAASVELLSPSAPALFVENQGQWSDASIRYAYQSGSTGIAFTDSALRFALSRSDASPGFDPLDPASTPPAMASTSFSASFLGASLVSPSGLQQSPSRFHYYLGDASLHRSEVPAYQQLLYPELYPGIDLVTFGQAASLKYEFHVAPGADYRQVQVRYEGIEGLRLAPDGSLLIHTALGEITDAAPVIYQEIAGQRVAVPGRYLLRDGQTYGFALTGPYDPRYALVLDPELAWANYLGPQQTSASGIALDGSGNAWVVGEVRSLTWGNGGFDPTANGGPDGFVAKINADGTLAWTSYLGGDDWDDCRAVAVDPSGNAWVTGYTQSANWVSGGFDSSLGAGSDALVAKINANGTLAWSSYLGGSGLDGSYGLDYGYGIATDLQGNAYVVGHTSSAGWTRDGFDTTLGGAWDGFVAKINAYGALDWTSYLGGSDTDRAFAIATDHDGNALITGETSSADGPMSGFDPLRGTGGFLARINANGTFGWARGLGGIGKGVAAASSGRVWVTGYTSSAGWTTGGFDTSYNGQEDGFVATYQPDGTLAWSSYIGGEEGDRGYAIATDGKGNAWITGDTNSRSWISGGFDTLVNGKDAFVLKISVDGALAWSSYLGGNSSETGYALATDASGNGWITGTTNSPAWAGTGLGFPYTSGTVSFVAKVLDPSNFPPTSLTLSATSLPENRPAGTLVGTLSAADPDPGESLSYSLVSGPGADHNALFSLSGNQLRSAASFNYEQQSTCLIRLRVTDAGGAFLDRAFTLSITNLNEPPANLSLSASSLPADAPVGTLVGLLSASDPDAGDTLSFAFASGYPDHSYFSLAGNQLRTAALFPAGKTSATLRLRATDAGGMSTEAILLLTLTSPPNRAPTALTLSASTIPAAPPPGTLIGSFSGSDPDPLDTLSFSLVPGAADNALFQIQGTALHTAGSFPAGPGVYTVQVRVTDSGGLFLQQDFTLHLAGPLLLTGTTGDDVLLVERVGSAYQITLNGVLSTHLAERVTALELHTLAGNDQITLGSGIPGTLVKAGAGHDTISGGEGQDTLYGDDGEDSLTGHAGDDLLYGNWGNDTLDGGEGHDQILAGLGNDSILGGLGNDSLYAGDHSDTIYGNDGEDYIEARGKADTVYGGAGNDTLWGGAGSDLLYGNAGDDWLDGGYFAFADTLTGGAGTDTAQCAVDDLNDLLGTIENLLYR